MRFRILSLVVLFAGGSLASVPSAFAHDDAEPRVTSPRLNHPPKMDGPPRITPRAGSTFGDLTRLRVGRVTRVSVPAEDPDGDPLHFSVVPLPPGATFDAATGELLWRPAAVGRFERS